MEKGKVVLQIDTSEALKKIEDITAKLEALKKGVLDKDLAVNIVPQFSTKKLNTALNTINDAFSKAFGDGAKGAKKVSDTIIEGTKKEQKALEDKQKTQNKLNKTEKEASRQRQADAEKAKTNATEIGRKQDELAKAQRQALNDHINSITNLQKNIKSLNQVFQNTVNLYRQFSEVGKSTLGSLMSGVTSIMNKMGLDVSGILDSAIEQEEKLQMARIGWGNMFGQDIIESLEARVKATAEASPGLNSGDLATYISQIGAVTGDANKSFEVTMGLLKTLQYGGADNIDQQMNYVIKNLRDVMAKGKATATDVGQFNRAMPLLTKALEAVGASDFLKDGELTITKKNIDQLVDAFASLNSPDSPAYGIFDQTKNTWSGIKEELGETMDNLVNDMLRSVGFYEAAQNIMRNGMFPAIEGIAEDGKKLFMRISAGTNWDEVGREGKQSSEAIREAGSELVNGIVEAFAVVDENGNIDATESLKQALKLIKEFFVGAIDGIKSIVEIIGKIRQTLGDEGISRLAYALGSSAITGGLTSGVLSTAGNVASGVVNFGLESYKMNLLKKAAGLNTEKSTGIIGKGVDKVSSLLGGSGFKPGWAAAGLSLAAVGETAGHLITEFNLLGDASKAVGGSITVASGVLGGAMTGLAFGPIGAVAGALLGFTQSIWTASKELEKLKVEKAEKQAVTAKSNEIQAIVDSSLALMKEKGATLDWTSDEGKWVVSNFTDELNKMSQEELNELGREGILTRLAELMDMKQRQMAWTQVDNTDAFSGIGGNKIELLRDRGDGTAEATEAGRKLAELIRLNNGAGVELASDLKNMEAETLLKRYFNTSSIDNINKMISLEEIAYLEQQSNEIAGNVAESTLGVVTRIQKEVGKIDENILPIIKGMAEDGEIQVEFITRQYGKTLTSAQELAYTIDGALISATRIINNALADTGYSSLELLELRFGEQATKNSQKWEEAGANKMNPWIWLFGDNSKREELSWLAGLGGNYINNDQATSLAFSMVAGLRDASKNPAFTDERRAELTASLQEAEAALDEFTKVEPNDWDKLLQLFRLIKDITEGQGIRIIDPTSDTYRDADEYRSHHSNGGHIRPIYRASGGDARGVDTIPAMLAPGEFVQRASAVARAGLGVMSALNNGDLGMAYRLLGAKVNNNTTNSRQWHYSDSHNSQKQQINYNYNYTQSARVNAYRGQANYMAL